MASPVPEQDLSDLAEVVLTKLRETGIKDAHPIVLVFNAKVVHGRPMDEVSMKVERVWLNGAVHWLLYGDALYWSQQKGTKVQPVVQDPRTVVRFALGRARELAPAGKDIAWRVDMQMRVNAGGVHSVLWSSRISYECLMNAHNTLETELGMVRVLSELARVRMVPVDQRA